MLMKFSYHLFRHRHGAQNAVRKSAAPPITFARTGISSSFARFPEIDYLGIARVQILDDPASHKPRAPKERLGALVRCVRGSKQLSRRALRLGFAKKPQPDSPTAMRRCHHDHRDESGTEERVVQHRVPQALSAGLRDDALAPRQRFVDRCCTLEV